MREILNKFSPKLQLISKYYDIYNIYHNIQTDEYKKKKSNRKIKFLSSKFQYPGMISNIISTTMSKIYLLSNYIVGIKGKVRKKVVKASNLVKKSHNVDAFTRLLRAIRCWIGTRFGRFEKNEIFIHPLSPWTIFINCE